MIGQQELLSANQAARRISADVTTVTYWIKTKLLPAVMVGGTWIIKVEDLEKVNAWSLSNPERKVAMRKRQKASVTNI